MKIFLYINFFLFKSILTPFAKSYNLKIDRIKCASLILQNSLEGEESSLLDIYEGKECNPTLYDEFEAKIKHTRVKIWNKSCNSTVCGWDGSFGMKCTQLINGENNLSKEQKNYLIGETNCECESLGGSLCETKSPGCDNRPINNPRVCGTLYFEDGCRDCNSARVSITFGKSQQLTPEFSRKLKSIRVRKGCTLVAIYRSEGHKSSGRTFFKKSVSSIKVNPVLTVYYCFCDCKLISDPLYDDGPTNFSCPAIVETTTDVSQNLGETTTEEPTILIEEFNNWLILVPILIISLVILIVFIRTLINTRRKPQQFELEVDLNELRTKLKRCFTPWCTFRSLIGLGEIARGSFGVVIKAIDVNEACNKIGYAIKCVDILKTINYKTLPDSYARINKLLNEIDVLSELHSEHVVKFHNCWVETDRGSLVDRHNLEAYISQLVSNATNSANSTESFSRSHMFLKMEYCDISLEEYISKLIRIIRAGVNCYTNIDKIVWDIIRQLCTGLEYIHSKGVNHRDLKPANILGQFKFSKNSIVWKIADFGLALLAMDGEGYHGSQAGTKIYRSPERMRGSAYNTKSDVYSFGLCCLELAQLNGNTFMRSKVFSDLIKFDEPGRRKLIDGIMCRSSVELQKVVRKMLEKETTKRWSAARVLSYMRSVDKSREIVVGK
ncbi:Interferon-induced, double-stranded RNA-activated protein kinase [Folsomia candida]|uniref:Interferon-induced, double-stranded RNA-activated protein kinase n=1 Tax=Folsomia candida TaxID=158441 RepID=A0A226DMZ7_FOLCA|nr:Interferon-induced, double-stranded RNA-activated protein kinase [Folsomia candida]